jgi:hypothetical protein
MSLDEDLKDAFARHAEDVQPDLAAWGNVEQKVRRAHYRRATAVSVFAVALIAAAAVAIPKLRNLGPERHGFTQTSGSPTPGASGSVGAETHAGAREGFKLAIQIDWRAGWFEGVYEYQPPGVQGLQEGGDTFAVTVKLVEGPYDKAGSMPSGATVTTINGHRALRHESTKNGEHTVTYRIEWAACLNGVSECSSNFSNNALEVRLLGSTDALWQKYGDQGEAVAHSIHTYDGSEPGHGTFFDPSIKRDHLSAALVKFLDSRVEGFGAEAFMTTQASDEYSKRDVEHGLYQGGSPRQGGYVFFRFMARHDVDANSSEFVVEMFWRYNSPPGYKDTFKETIGVGPGKNLDGFQLPAVVRFANLGI